MPYTYPSVLTIFCLAQPPFLCCKDMLQFPQGENTAYQDASKDQNVAKLPNITKSQNGYEVKKLSNELFNRWLQSRKPSRNTNVTKDKNIDKLADKVKKECKAAKLAGPPALQTILMPWT